MEESKIKIPRSIQIEHEAIHSLLVEATKASGRVGEAANNLARILHPHFVREEQIAMPPLGLLSMLAAGIAISDDMISEAVTITDALRNELPKLLEEHKEIHAAVTRLRDAAKQENMARYERLADQLALHAQNEEEVLYPTAILVGEVIKGRLTHSR